MERLNRPADFQALTSAVRSLLEICVDCLLLKDANELALKKYELWKYSAKLNYASSLLDYFKNIAKRPVPPDFYVVAEFFHIENQK